MSTQTAPLGQRIKAARERAGVSQDEARLAIGVSQPTYSRLEAGTRPVTGDELVILADQFGVRTATITGLAAMEQRALFAARTDGTTPSTRAMRDRLYAYLELDSYLTDQGIPAH